MKIDTQPGDDVMNDIDIPEDLTELINKQRFCVLATADSGHPYANLVSFATTSDLKSILFATKRQTNKYRNISSESRTALLIDNRGNDPDDIKQAIIVTALGHSKEVNQGKDDKLKLFLDKHPYMKDFVEDPDCALMELDVSKYIFVKEFEVTRSFEI
jgi:general stress protein 26